MPTIINNPSNPPERVIEVDRTDSTSTVVLVLILVIALIGAGWLYTRYHHVPAAPATSNGGTNINVTLPPADQNPSQNQSGGGAPAY